MSIPVKLQAFEGPLDLLLHLIDKNKINIYDIPVVEITEQYLEYIKGLDQQDLDKMSEFLVMAATLINIKSKMLLPTQEEDKEEEDPRQELVERLLEYKKYKHASFELAEKQQDASRMIFKNPTIPDGIMDYEDEIDVSEILKDVNLSKLYLIFRSVVKKQSDKIDPVRSNFGEIKREEVNISDKIDYIRSIGEDKKKISFRHLLEEMCSKLEVIVTFLAILEMIKMGAINIVQEDIFDDIMIDFLG